MKIPLEDSDSEISRLTTLSDWVHTTENSVDASADTETNSHLVVRYEAEHRARPRWTENLCSASTFVVVTMIVIVRSLESSSWLSLSLCKCLYVRFSVSPFIGVFFCQCVKQLVHFDEWNHCASRALKSKKLRASFILSMANSAYFRNYFVQIFSKAGACGEDLFRSLNYVRDSGWWR